VGVPGVNMIAVSLLHCNIYSVQRYSWSVPGYRVLIEHTTVVNHQWGLEYDNK